MADDRVNIAIVGLNFGRHIAAALLREPASRSMKLCLLCDLDLDRGTAIAAELGVKFTGELDAVLADPQIEAVGLFTPPVKRSNLIRKIIRAGKHVMTTKPFDLDPAAAATVLAEAGQLNKVVHLNSPSPLWSDDLKQTLEWADEFKLGRIISCRQSVWARYQEKADGTWYDDPVLCPVAPIFRLGIYGINDMVRLLGNSEKVTAVSSRIFTGRPTPDNAQASILLKSGAIGNVFASFCVDDGQSYSNSMIVNYEKGSIYRNVGPFPFGEVLNKSHMALVAKSGAAQTEIRRATLRSSSGEYQWEVFARAVRGERLLDETSPAQIVEGLKIIVAMARADATGMTILVD